MTRYISDQNVVGFLYESGTYNTATGTTLQWAGLITEHNIVDSENVTSVRYLGGGDRNVDVQVNGALDHEGTMTFHPQDWKLLGFALGSTVDTGSPSPYQHTLNEANSDTKYAFVSGAQNPFASFTVEDFQDGITAGSNFVRTAKGCVVDTWELSAAQGEQLTCTVTYRAQSVEFSSGASTGTTAATTRPFRWNDVKIHVPSGTVLTEATDFTLTVANNVEMPHYIGTGNRTAGVPIPLNRDYTLNVTLHGTSQITKTLYDNYFRGGSKFNVLFSVEDTEAGAGSRDMFWSFSGCRITEMEAPSPSEGVDEQTITIVPESSNVVVDDLIELYNPW